MKEVTFLEKLAERLLEGGFQRALKPRLQPVQIAKALARGMERSQVVGSKGPMVANRYRACLHPDDLAAISGFRGTLEREFANYLRDYGSRHGLKPLSTPTVALLPSDPPGRLGQIRVEATMVDVDPTPSPVRSIDTPGWGGTVSMPVVKAAATPAAAPSRAAFLRDALGQAIPLPGKETSIGRAIDNDIVLDSGDASRRQARIVREAGQYFLLDPESTNGSFVNGRRVTRHPLSEEDTIDFGGTAFTFHLADSEV
jgi:Protein of unknown function (DUF3662)/FHA domain